jgi:hypothetical protein
VRDRTERRAKALTPQRPRSALKQLSEWEAHVSGQETASFVRYSTEGTFRQGDLMLHRKFGQGYVVAVLDDGKISVLFRDGPRTLVQGQP